MALGRKPCIRESRAAEAWVKTNGPGKMRIGNSPVVASWEPILMWGIHTLGVKRDELVDVLRCPTEPNAFGHPAPKPLGLFRALTVGLSDPGATLVDPFAGTGTTLLAAKVEGRRAIGIEIEERYCEIAANRLAQGVLWAA